MPTTTALIINAVMAHYAPDNVTFDLMPPLQVLGAGA